MNATAFAPARRERRRWGDALAALRRLLRDNDDTFAVFDIMRALDGRASDAGFGRLAANPASARLAAERPELEPMLMDDAWLDGFADGTVGAAYRGFVREERLSAAGLAGISLHGDGVGHLDSDDPVAWYRRRVRDVHDLWHTLTGYGRDPLGEACLVAFSYSQTKGLGWLLIAIGALVKGGSVKLPGIRAAIIEGFRHGRRATWLPALDYERVMAMSLDEARGRFGIAPPARYRAVIAGAHASGIDPRSPYARPAGR